jgi:hypothetical protein
VGKTLQNGKPDGYNVDSTAISSVNGATGNCVVRATGLGMSESFNGIAAGHS